jgi:hypothetical protein
MRSATAINLGYLWSPGFCFALALLLTNDFILKHLIPGPITGKLSDFAGIFAFSFFGGALAGRYRTAVYVGTALLFVAWKIPIATPAIRTWNQLAPFAVDRVADISDLWALAALPASYWYLDRRSRVPESGGLKRWAVASLAVFAFVATSYSTHETMNEVWVYEGSPNELFEKLREVNVTVFTNGETYSTAVPRNGWALQITSDVCFGKVDAYVVVHAVGTKSEIRLVGMSHRCPRTRDDAAKLRNEFLTKVVKEVGLRRLDARRH